MLKKLSKFFASDLTGWMEGAGGVVMENCRHKKARAGRAMASVDS